MGPEEIIKSVKSLKLPKDSFIVYGSCPMALVGIRKAGDIDLYVTAGTLEELKKRGWKMVEKGIKDTPLVYGVFEAHDNWEFSEYRPTFLELLSRADLVEGIPFASLEDVRKWKLASDNPKFARDVELIDGYYSAIKPK